jgi:hypothetical protein
MRSKPSKGEAADALTGTIGTFVAHTAMLKKIYQQNGPKENEEPVDNND